jgi:hypothetical protein
MAVNISKRDAYATSMPAEILAADDDEGDTLIELLEDPIQEGRHGCPDRPASAGARIVRERCGN